MRRDNEQPQRGRPRPQGRRAQEPDGDPFEQEDFMQGRNPERVGQGGEGFAAGPGDQLWEEYRVRPTWSQARKVECLYVDHKMNREEIARLLNIKEGVVLDTIKDIEAEWEREGQSLNAEGRERERGQIIARYNRLLADIETEIGNNPDPRLLAQKAGILKELVNLRGLAADRKDISTLKEVDPFLEAVAALTPDRLVSLAAALGPPQTAALLGE